MSQTIRVDLHCHSSLSDGEDLPAGVARQLAASHVAWGSLTDHNNIDGIEVFRQALERANIQCLSGVELDVVSPVGRLHILAYGFDPEDAGLRAILPNPRHSWRTWHAPDAAAALRIVHEAGGLAFLAHPLSSLGSLEGVDAALEWLQPRGLDGIEVFHKPYSQGMQDDLRRLAERRGLLMSPGSDYHGLLHDDGAPPGLDMPLSEWRRFTAALRGAREARNSRMSTEPPDKGGTLETNKSVIERLIPPQRAGFILRIVLPAVLAIILFILAIFLIIIPRLEDELVAGKQETTQELTRAAVSILDEYYQEETAGTMTRAEAQEEAAARIEKLRWGDQGLDYFWITDMRPTMIMHPYLPELDGQDLTDYEDQRGKRLFVEMVEEVRDDGAGFVEYDWQWQDDPQRIVPKISYVQRFDPWDWVIGTGIYVEDVNAAVGSVQRNLVYIAIGIIVVIALLLLYGARQSLKIEQRRASAEEGLKESHEKYRALVEAATEGILMTLDGKSTYFNQPLLDMLGYAPEELVGTDASDLFVSDTPADKEALAPLEALTQGATEDIPASFEARLRTKDGRAVETLLAPTPIELGGKTGYILIARSLSGQKAMAAALDETRRQFRNMSDVLSLGMFRSTWGRKASLVEVNPAMRGILQLPDTVDLVGTDWLDHIIDDDERDALVAKLNREKVVQDYHLAFRRPDGGRLDVSLFAVLIEDESGQVVYCDGILEDITTQRKGEEEREALIAQLQTSLFFLQEPLVRSITPALSLDMDQPISRAAALMTKNKTGALFVTAPDGDGELLGIVTDHDFRERVVAQGVTPDTHLRSIMTAPVATISAQAPIYEALLRMQERGVDYLAVLDDAGRLAGMIHLRDLVHYQRSSSVIITDSVRRARSVEDILEAQHRLPALVKAVVDSGADTRYLNRIISGVSDSVVQRLIAMAEEKLGPAPTRFSFLALGSEGREEQTLLTDQDNALLYEDPPAEQAEETAKYFLDMGTLVSDWLAQVGYAYCEGGVMAKNPRWNLSQSQWRDQFVYWIHNADPQELLELNMLFDFRAVSGEKQFARDLRSWVFEQMDAYPLFYLHFAQNVLLYKPPLSMLGNIQAHSATADGRKAVSLKEALLPIVNFARLYALKHHIDSTNTLDRLGELKERGILSRETYEQIVPDYETLMRIRLQRQAIALEENRKPSNLILPQELTSAEEMKLKRLFTATEELRRKISYEFLGGISGF